MNLRATRTWGKLLGHSAGSAQHPSGPVSGLEALLMKRSPERRALWQGRERSLGDSLPRLSAGSEKVFVSFSAYTHAREVRMSSSVTVLRAGGEIHTRFQRGDGRVGVGAGVGPLCLSSRCRLDAGAVDSVQGV